MSIACSLKSVTVREGRARFYQKSHIITHVNLTGCRVYWWGKWIIFYCTEALKNLISSITQQKRMWNMFVFYYLDNGERGKLISTFGKLGICSH